MGEGYESPHDCVAAQEKIAASIPLGTRRIHRKGAQRARLGFLRFVLLLFVVNGSASDCLPFRVLAINRDRPGLPIC